MFFLLRVAFWLTIVLALLPSGRGSQTANAKVGTADAVGAAGAAMSDMSSFCDRQPDACVVGAQAAVAIGQRAQAGARMIFDFLNDRASPTGTEAGSVTKVHSTSKPGPKLAAAVQTVPVTLPSQNTLNASDFDPAWQGPPMRTENVPLPRKAPHRKV
jgi:hypothetical protein